jgi:hypothetical protein
MSLSEMQGVRVGLCDGEGRHDVGLSVWQERGNQLGHPRSDDSQISFKKHESA